MENLNAPASKDCVLLAGPCGGRAAANPTVAFAAGKNASIVFQKNLNHWTAGSPGMFEITYNVAGDKDVTVLKTIPDTNSPSLTLYVEEVVIPNRISTHSVIGVQYITKNPNAPAVFYQCADVRVEEHP
eukprot:CAMPEP_0168511774 /NCGR_PEP_ID=MMETSP0405-20121227/2361_1 /TAXON_ID=498012 /ORGANISM="Trichosphaerium sp, Strain Am-I-7 wt" /LENGTH=128 /DNA_ID=CAMNT_0008530067 /DNA_START=124 /DNA_END=510 /DNA_ORIENTATION=+